MATALIQFAQGYTTDEPGRSIRGSYYGGPVTCSNGDDLGVVLWKWELLYVPPGSEIPLLVQGPGTTPTFEIPNLDRRGSYRVRLTIVDGAGNSDVDIRNVIVPFDHGFMCPPFQGEPAPLPRSVKPDELNLGGQGFGWVGDSDSQHKFMYQLIERFDALSVGPVPSFTTYRLGATTYSAELTPTFLVDAYGPGIDVTAYADMDPSSRELHIRVGLARKWVHLPLQGVGLTNWAFNATTGELTQTSITTAGEVRIPIELPQSYAFDNGNPIFSVRFWGASGHSSVPATKPTAAIWKQTLTVGSAPGAWTLVATVTDPSTTVAAYEKVHATSATLTVPITTGERYQLRLTGETGAGAVVGLSVAVEVATV